MNKKGISFKNNNCLLIYYTFLNYDLFFVLKQSFRNYYICLAILLFNFYFIFHFLINM